jgi:molybdopterin synthase sulfur carrier subunit
MLTNPLRNTEESRVAVQIRIPTILRPDTGGNATVAVEGATVGEVFGKLVAEYPNLTGKVVTDEGQLHKFVNVYVNDDDVRYLDKLDTKVTDADTITILPAVAGG